MIRRTPPLFLWALYAVLLIATAIMCLSVSSAGAQDSAEMTNASCLECHNADILTLSPEDLAGQVEVDASALPKVRPLFVTGELNLAINEKRFAEGVHADITCIGCHKGISEVPHKQRLAPVDCRECHDDAVESVKKSAHGVGAKAVGCVGCHDVHYGKGKDSYEAKFQRQACVDCHKAYGRDLVKGHTRLYEAKLHLGLDCMLCHAGKEPGVHNIPAAKTKSAGCESCHSKNTILATTKTPGGGNFLSPEMLNADVAKKYGYVVGANRIPLLDTIIVLAFFAPFALPLFHGGLRFITRRKEPVELPEEKILLHPFTERLWHWVQAFAIVMLIITGVIIHWSEHFPGMFAWAVRWHNIFGWVAVIAFIVWLLYNLLTMRIKHYIPSKEDLTKGVFKQAKFYSYGIFKHEPHPYAPSEDNKFNPLQKLSYLQFQGFLLPILLISGLLYMYPQYFKGVINAIGGMQVLAIVHIILGGLFAAFLVAHIYLATTGETIGENFKAIITGRGLASHHEEHGKDDHRHV